jgi:LPS-assembly protein
MAREMSAGGLSLARAVWVSALLMALSAAAHAQSGFEINMDELVDDAYNGRVVARGKVEIRYFGEILTADEVIYDRRTRKLTARGHIELQEAGGKLSRADAMNLTDDLRDAFIAYARRQKVRIDR